MSDTLYDSLHTPPDLAAPAKCQYVSKRGTRCPRDTVEDEPYCVLHGASIAKAQETIRRRLVALQEKSVATIEEIFLLGDDKTRLAAATAVLDRTGLGPKSTIALDKLPADMKDMSLEQITQELDTLAKTARDEMTRQRMNEAHMTQPSASDATH